MEIISTAAYRFDLLGPIMQMDTALEKNIAFQVLPILGVNKLTGAIPTFLQTDQQIISVVHAKGAAYQRIISQINTLQFTCNENGLEEALASQDYDIISRDMAEISVGAKLIDNVMRANESAVATALTTGWTGATTAASNGAWNSTNGDPFTDILAACQAITDRTGLPQTEMSMALGQAQYNRLLLNPKVQANARAVLGYSGEYAMTAIQLQQDPAVLAKVFGLKRIHVARQTYNSAAAGQTASYSEVWPVGYAFVFVGSDSPESILPGQITLGRTFVYDIGLQIGSLATGKVNTNYGFVLEMYRDETVSSDILRARNFVGPTILVQNAGQLLTGV